MLSIEWAGEELGLLCDRAVHWPRSRCLIIADPHFGKAAAFRSLGVPVPGGTTQHDVDRLSRMIRETGVQRLIILGDFLHARHGRAESTMSTLQRWREQHHLLEITLVRGNHDANAGDPPAEWNVNCVEAPHFDAPFAFRHEPAINETSHAMCGHIHPCVLLHDTDGSAMRVSCFLFSEHMAILPAFGSFTGSHKVRPRRGDRVFAVGQDAVVEIPGVRASHATM